jgi:SAM-dependent methyltransferase
MPTAQEVRAWYNRRYASLGLDSMRPFEAYPLVLDLLAARAGATLLDVSCGSGFLLQAAQARGLSAYGVDLSDAAVRLVRQVSPATPVAVCAGEELCLQNGYFDFVTCLGSLEHFLDVSRGLQEMMRVAKPGAQFCIMVPNRDFAGWKVMGKQGTAQQDINERLLSLSEWRRIFEDQGLRVRRVVPDRWHAVKWRSDPRRRSAAYVARGLLLEVAWRLLPLAWEYQFIFLLERR